MEVRAICFYVRRLHDIANYQPCFAVNSSFQHIISTTRLNSTSSFVGICGKKTSYQISCQLIERCCSVRFVIYFIYSIVPSFFHIEKMRFVSTYRKVLHTNDVLSIILFNTNERKQSNCVFDDDPAKEFKSVKK